MYYFNKYLMQMFGIVFIMFLFGAQTNGYTQVRALIEEIKMEGHEVGMRGLYTINDKVVWASGKRGSFFKTEDGELWKKGFVVGCDSLDFRDVHAFDDKNALVMSSGKGGFIYRTEDGGETWKEVYKNLHPKVFLNGMDFWNSQNGIACGDPVEGQLFLIYTSDGGQTWNRLLPLVLPASIDNEAGFAASGTGIACVGDSVVYIGMGNAYNSRIFKSTDRGRIWKVFNTPLRSGKASGIYSLSFFTPDHGVVVGGNYLDSTNSEANCAITIDGGEHWRLPAANQPQGYRSCICTNTSIMVSTGRTGTDISYDQGETWEPLSKRGYYSCVLQKKVGWLIGRNGRLAKIILETKP